MAKQKILVTGANGQLGMELQRLASQQAPYDFIFLSRSELAIEQAESAERLFQLHRPGFCINCAAYTAVDKAEEEKEGLRTVHPASAERAPCSIRWR